MYLQQARAFSGAIIDDLQYTEPANIGELIRHDIQQSLALIGTSIDAREPTARLRPPRLRTASFSCRQSRKSFWWFTRCPPRLSSTWRRRQPTRRRLYPLAKTIIVAAPGFLTDCHSAKAHGFMRPSFAYFVAPHQNARQLSAWLRVQPLLSQKVFHNCIIAHRVSHEPLQLGVLVCMRLQPLGSKHVPCRRIWPSIHKCWHR